MGLGRDRPVGHGAGGEALDDLARRLDLVQRDRGPVLGAQPEHPAQRPALADQAVALRGVAAEHVLLVGARRVLQQEDVLRAEQVQLALAPVGVLAADVETAVHELARVVRVGLAVALGDLRGHDVEPAAPELARGAGEVLVDELLREPDRLEDLRGGVAGHRGDAHLGHHLAHALDQRADVVADRLARLDVGEDAVGGHVLDRLERQVRVDRGRAEAEQQRHVVDLAGVAALDHQRGLGALPGGDEVVVHRRGQQQRRDRRQAVVGVAVGEHQDALAVLDGVATPRGTRGRGRRPSRTRRRRPRRDR